MDTLELSINEEQVKSCANAMINLASTLKEVNEKVLSMLANFETSLSVSHNKTLPELPLLNEARQSLLDVCDGLDK